MDEIIEVLRRIHGLDVSMYDKSFLANSFEKRWKASVCDTAADYLRRLSEDRQEAEAFSRALRVGYSEFFRNPVAFALLEQMILPVLLNCKKKSGRDEIRVWSAGCAAGQEAWSIAILLDELSVAQGLSVPVRIFATDISEADLFLARTGVYHAEAVGNVRLRHLREYFSSQGDAFAIVPRLRDMVDFSTYDLLGENTTCPPVSIFGNFDIIFCSNVLYYYSPLTQRLILDKLRQCLASGGYLITDETERQIVESSGGFRAILPKSAIFENVTARVRTTNE